ncbi:MAG: histidine kinase [Acidobacteria bacterium]|nr:histidine kinase [Acidobacteriota bacterium]
MRRPLPIGKLMQLAVLVFIAFWLIQALAQASDLMRQDKPILWFRLLNRSFWFVFPWMLFSAYLTWLLDTRNDQLGQWRWVGKVLGLCLALFFAPYEIYLGTLYLIYQGKTITWSAISSSVSSMGIFIDSIYFAGCFGCIYGVVTLRKNLKTEWERQAVLQENAELNWQLEHQKLSALRAQLEPHFMFNALNGISAMVRADKKGEALHGLSQLSHLLRYALEASKREWVSLQSEVRFINEYLALQKLRFGERLSFEWQIPDASAYQVELPALILQPLVENAIRHDLECHDLPSNLNIAVTVDEPHLKIVIQNPIHPDEPKNPGTGLGLNHVSERLNLLYGPNATLKIHKDARFFRAEISVPLERSETVQIKEEP